MKSQRIQAVISAVKPPNILNLGCVNHRLPSSASEEAYWLHHQLSISFREANLLGVDIDTSNVLQMRERGYTVEVGDAHRLQYESRFDTIILGELIEHLQSPGECIAGCMRALKPGGRIIITTPNAFSIMLGIMYLKDFDQAFNREHVMWFCPQTLRAFVERCGLRITQFKFVDELEPDVTPAPLYRIFAYSWYATRWLLPRRYRNTMVAVCEPVNPIGNPSEAALLSAFPPSQSLL
jgi:SAM-dependent methyltransferase